MAIIRRWSLSATRRRSPPKFSNRYRQFEFTSLRHPVPSVFGHLGESIEIRARARDLRSRMDPTNA